ncbi:ATP-binding protein [Moellerella wisconsensis]|uniref:ATP-binding protein n=1 Tax=Moellerella wisconsensis TaxID=158849 RepID=UPI0025AF3EAD|nr:ATP-binding protein [Moellerella wisconsensis]WJW81029.1 ATP-binding protein [Moellerella wisconsensis]
MSAFERLTSRMDALTATRMGKPMVINDIRYIGVDAHFLPEFGPVTGDGLSVVIFSSGYQPRKHDVVIADGERHQVTRFQRFNGKWMIFLEGADDEGER